MRDIDKGAIQGLGIPGMVLMKNAGRGCLYEIESRYGPISEKGIVIISGKGNNGGDGFVIARHSANRGGRVSTFLVGKKGDVSGDARINLDILSRMGLTLTEIRDENEFFSLRSALSGCEIVVDAIFGTGFTGEIQGLTKNVIEAINSVNVPVVSIDIPSGLSGEDGRVSNICVRASLTCTLGLPKRGLYLYPGRLFAGEIEVIDIGLPPSLSDNVPVELTEPSLLRRFLPERPPDGHKGTFGKVLVLGGSPGMTGAVVLSSLSALKSGAGLVYLGIPSSLNSILEEKATEVVTIPLPETSSRTISTSAIDVLERYPVPDLVVIGPGMGNHQETREFILSVIKTLNLPIIIDADGLNNLRDSDLEGAHPPLILTPHPGELSRLTGESLEYINQNRIDSAISLAKRWNCTLVLKGAPTVIAGEAKCYLNTSGCSALATAGSGDVLTGIIAGLCAQGAELLSASVLGVYLHGLSGDIAAREKTEYGVIAGDVMENIPSALCQVLGVRC